MNDLILMTFAFLLPLVPAYALYRLLPSRTRVTGPFKGLNLQLSGAFGGYFLLVLIAFGFLSSRPQPTKTDEVWEVTGRIDCQQDGDPIDADQIRFSLLPPTYHTGGDGRFLIRVPATREPTGERRFPTLVIEHADHQTVSIDLNDEGARFGQEVRNLRRREAARAITVEDVISLTRNRPYQPAGEAPPPQVASLGTEGQ